MRLLGHGKFHRLRIGIGHPGHKDRVTPWVLGRASAGDDIEIARAIDDAIAVLTLAVAGEFSAAVKRLPHSRDSGLGWWDLGKQRHSQITEPLYTNSIHHID